MLNADQLFDSFDKIGPAPKSNIAEIEPTSKSSADRRDSRRVIAQLKVAIIYHHHADESTRPTYHGKTSDVSMTGISVVVSENIFSENEVTVLLAVPSAHYGGAQKIVEATAKMVYTVFSSEYDAFRVGLNFRQFKRNGKEVFESLIEERFVKRKI